MIIIIYQNVIIITVKYILAINANNKQYKIIGGSFCVIS